jgi:hypothetical protein
MNSVRLAAGCGLAVLAALTDPACATPPDTRLEGPLFAGRAPRQDRRGSDRDCQLRTGVGAHKERLSARVEQVVGARARTPCAREADDNNEGGVT